MNWKIYPNFNPDEFRCRHTGLGDGLGDSACDIKQRIKE